MKHCVAGIVGLASAGLVAAPASSADIAAAPLARAPVFVNSWAGFYLGAHGGYGWGNNDFRANLDVAFALDGIKSKGAIYGGQAGYNWQSGRIVTGVELDFSSAELKGSTTRLLTSAPGSSFFVSRDDDTKYLGTARARLGWLAAENLLLYGTAGLGWERVDRTETQVSTTTFNGIPVFLSSTSRTPADRFGWVAGAGAEVALWNSNWVGRVEYLHYDFATIESTASLALAPPGPSLFDRGGHQTIEAVRAGLSYRFGVLGAPASVAYGKAPVAAPPSSWAGFYLGVHGGYGWGDDGFSITASAFGPNALINGIKSEGWVAGGQVGHNWQFDRIVTGLELDLSGTGIRGTSTTSVLDRGGGDTETVKFADRVKYLGTARGRLGWLPTDNILLYGTAGLAWERIEQSVTDVIAFAPNGGAPGFTTMSIATTPVDHFGWVAGAGAESLLFGTNWVARLEYLHHDFGQARTSTTFTGNFPAFFSTASSSGHQTIDIVRAGVSYKFGDPAAPSAAVPTAKAPPLAPPSNWAGFYLGGHGGYGWGDNDFSLDQGPNPRTNGIKSRGWMAGGQAGYLWQFGRAVAGLEADFSVAGINGDCTPLVTNAGIRTDTLSDSVKYLGTARGRLGGLPLDHLLIYGTGGLAWERINRTATTAENPPLGISTFTTPADRFGWVAGIGAETMLWNSNWIGRLEYLHHDFGTIQATSRFSSTRPTDQASADRGGRQTIDVMRAGVSYKFNDGGAVVAKD